ncbi:MAG: zinc ribbon domain-containing protein [Deltaproteobacteria bacterium]|nr:zinc ribbon domain-containing protein [Deltaproteobacteria bacterium]
MSRLTVTPQGDALMLAGAIDETADLMSLLGRAQGGRLALDLAGVTFINSLGVRDWIRFQSTATQQGLQVELRRVAEVLIHQLNMIIATRGTARVTSFFAPYACDKCGREESLLVDAVANAQGLARLEPPPMTCPECGGAMAFNDFPERYFSFLSQG